MKITKRQLRKIIRETRLPMDARDNTQRSLDRSSIAAALKMLYDALNILEDMGYEEAADDVSSAVDQISRDLSRE